MVGVRSPANHHLPRLLGTSLLNRMTFIAAPTPPTPSIISVPDYPLKCMIHMQFLLLLFHRQPSDHSKEMCWSTVVAAYYSNHHEAPVPCQWRKSIPHPTLSITANQFPIWLYKKLIKPLIILIHCALLCRLIHLLLLLLMFLLLYIGIDSGFNAGGFLPFSGKTIARLSAQLTKTAIQYSLWKWECSRLGSSNQVPEMISFNRMKKLPLLEETRI